MTERFRGRSARKAVERLEADLGLSARDLARALDTDRRSISRWISGQTLPQREARRRLNHLLALHEQLGETFADYRAARQWLHAPSKYLGGLTPAAAIHAGRIDRAEAAPEALESGVFV